RQGFQTDFELERRKRQGPFEGGQPRGPGFQGERQVDAPELRPLRDPQQLSAALEPAQLANRLIESASSANRTEDSRSQRRPGLAPREQRRGALIWLQDGHSEISEPIWSGKWGNGRG